MPEAIAASPKFAWKPGLSEMMPRVFPSRSGVRRGRSVSSPLVGPGIVCNYHARNEDMAAALKSSMTMREIGKIHGISRQRVQQILAAEFGLSAKDGWTAKRSEARQQEKRRRCDASSVAKFGCTLTQRRTIPLKARRAFVQQRQNARRDHALWDLTLWDWWHIWVQSGHWDNRGRAKYVLARLDRSQPWSKTNVIVTEIQAAIDSRGFGGVRFTPCFAARYTHED